MIADACTDSPRGQQKCWSEHSSQTAATLGGVHAMGVPKEMSDIDKRKARKAASHTHLQAASSIRLRDSPSRRSGRYIYFRSRHAVAILRTLRA